MTPAEKNKLLDRILGDQKFRAAFLRSPRKAADSIGIELTAAEAARFIRDRQKIKTNAAAYDKTKQFYKMGGPVPEGFIPVLPCLV